MSQISHQNTVNFILNQKIMLPSRQIAKSLNIKPYRSYSLIQALNDELRRANVPPLIGEQSILPCQKEQLSRSIDTWPTAYWTISARQEMLELLINFKTKKWTSESLADYFGVSVTTIKRDLSNIKRDNHFTVSWPNRNGYYQFAEYCNLYNHAYSLLERLLLNHQIDSTLIFKDDKKRKEFEQKHLTNIDLFLNIYRRDVSKEINVNQLKVFIHFYILCQQHFQWLVKQQYTIDCQFVLFQNLPFDQSIEFKIVSQFISRTSEGQAPLPKFIYEFLTFKLQMINGSITDYFNSDEEKELELMAKFIVDEFINHHSNQLDNLVDDRDTLIEKIKKELQLCALFIDLSVPDRQCLLDDDNRHLSTLSEEDIKNWLTKIIKNIKTNHPFIDNFSQKITSSQIHLLTQTLNCYLQAHTDNSLNVLLYSNLPETAIHALAQEIYRSPLKINLTIFNSIHNIKKNESESFDFVITNQSNFLLFQSELFILPADLKELDKKFLHQQLFTVAAKRL